MVSDVPESGQMEGIKFGWLMCLQGCLSGLFVRKHARREKWEAIPRAQSLHVPTKEFFWEESNFDVWNLCITVVSEIIDVLKDSRREPLKAPERSIGRYATRNAIARRVTRHSLSAMIASFPNM